MRSTLVKALIFALAFAVFFSLVEGKSKDLQKFEEYRAWAQSQLDAIAADLRKKGLTGYKPGDEAASAPSSRETSTGDDSGSGSDSNNSESSVDQATSVASTKKKRSIGEGIGSSLAKRSVGEEREGASSTVRTLGGETKFVTMKRRATRRLVPVSAELRNKNYPETEEVVVNDYDTQGTATKEQEIETPENEVAPPVEVNMSANTMMGSENEPFQKPLHETVDLPDETLPTSLLDERSEVKPIFRKRREGKVAKVLRNLVRPLLPPDDPPRRPNERLQEMAPPRYH